MSASPVHHPFSFFMYSLLPHSPLHATISLPPSPNVVITSLQCHFETVSWSATASVVRSCDAILCSDIQCGADPTLSTILDKVQGKVSSHTKGEK